MFYSVKWSYFNNLNSLENYCAMVLERDGITQKHKDPLISLMNYISCRICPYPRNIHVSDKLNSSLLLYDWEYNLGYYDTMLSIKNGLNINEQLTSQNKFGNYDKIQRSYNIVHIHIPSFRQDLGVVKHESNHYKFVKMKKGNNNNPTRSSVYLLGIFFQYDFFAIDLIDHPPPKAKEIWSNFVRHVFDIVEKENKWRNIIPYANPLFKDLLAPSTNNISSYHANHKNIMSTYQLSSGNIIFPPKQFSCNRSFLTSDVEWYYYELIKKENFPMHERCFWEYINILNL